MAHSLSPVPASATTPIARSSNILSRKSSLQLHRVWACHQRPAHVLDDKLVHRRTVTLSLAGTVLGLNAGDRIANAARRPPPPPPEEKKDPNVSGVQAKVLASKKRKEAMKQAVAKMREQGKPVDGPSSSEGKAVDGPSASE